jgi:hypothetical protein
MFLAIHMGTLLIGTRVAWLHALSVLAGGLCATPMERVHVISTVVYIWAFYGYIKYLIPYNWTSQYFNIPLKRINYCHFCRSEHASRSKPHGQIFI